MQGRDRTPMNIHYCRHRYDMSLHIASLYLASQHGTSAVAARGEGMARDLGS